MKGSSMWTERWWEKFELRTYALHAFQIIRFDCHCPSHESNLSYLSLCLCHSHAWVCHNMSEEAGGQLVEVGSPLPPREAWGWCSHGQVWAWVILLDHFHFAYNYTWPSNIFSTRQQASWWPNRLSFHSLFVMMQAYPWRYKLNKHLLKPHMHCK